MRKIREVLRLRSSGLSLREIGLSLKLGRTTVGEYIRRAEHAEVSWPVPEGLTDAALEALLFPPPRWTRER